MTLQELLKAQGIADEQITSIVDAMKENKLYISSEENLDVRYSKLKEQNAELETQLSDRDKQLTELSSKAKGNEELEKQIKELQDVNTQTKEEYEDKLSERDFSYKLESELRSAKAKNIKAVQALLDREVITLNEDKFTGLEDQLKALKESDPYLFEEEASMTSGGTGNFGKKDSKEQKETLGERLARQNAESNASSVENQNHYFK